MVQFKSQGGRQGGEGRCGEQVSDIVPVIKVASAGVGMFTFWQLELIRSLFSSAVFFCYYL